MSGYPIECKHVGGREPLETIIARYQPQMQWQMLVTGASQCALSVIMGGDPPIVEMIPRDEAYCTELMKRATAFMSCVERMVPPVALPFVAPPVVPTVTYDMQGNNAWADNASTWLDTEKMARRAAVAEKELKTLVPADAVLCHGHGVVIKRDRAGRLSLREER